MARTVLAAIALLGLLACGGSKPTPAARNTGGSQPAAQNTSNTTKSRQQRRTNTTADTAKHANPLTGR